MANITNVSCAYAGETLTVSVSWDTTETGALSIYDASGVAVNGTVTSSGAGYAQWQPATGAMIAGQPYWAQVVVSQIPSLKIALLWSAPTAIVSSFDGAILTLSWTAPTGLPAPGGYMVSIADGGVTQVEIASSTLISVIPSHALTVGDPWTITVAPTLGPSSGPEATGTVITAAVAVASVACTALSATTGQIAIQPGPTSATSFLATLSRDGTTVLSQTLPYTSGTPMPLPLPAGMWPLSPAGGYAIAIRAVGGSSTGPQGAALPVVVTAPVIDMAAVAGGATPTVTVAVTLPPGEPAPSGFTATVMNGAAKVGGGGFNGASGVLTLDAALAAGAYVLTVAAVSGPNSTGPTAQATLLTSAPSITAIDNDAGVATVTFTGAADIAVSQIDIAVGGVTVASGQTTASPARLPAPAVPFTVSVRGAAPGLLGPASGPVAMLSAAPAVEGVAIDLANTATLSWTPWAASAPTPAPDGFTIETYDGAKLTSTAAIAGGTSSSGALPAAGLVVGGAVTALVRSALTDPTTHAVLSGPRSQRVPVLANAPVALQARYDGATATLSWAAPAGAQVDGYLVTLTDSTGAASTATQRVAGTQAAIAFAAKATSVVTVWVQPTGGGAIGQAAATPLFTPGLFLSTNSANAAYLAPSASLAFGKQPLAIYLPAILANPGGTLPSNSSFALAATTTAPWTYLLTVNQTDAVWTFDASAIRTALLADITDLMTQLTAQGLTAQGDLLLRQVFARILPMTFIETMFYGYNFNAADGGAGQGQGLVDLTPGMGLRVELESYESLPTSISSNNAGMVGAAVFDFDIGGYRSASSWRQGLDAFLSRLVGHGVIFPGPSGGVTAPTQTGAGGSPDFFYPNFLQPYFRLIYPPTFLSSFLTAPDQSTSIDLRKNVTLIAAATRTALDAATNVLRSTTGNYQPVNAVYFRGRAMVSPRLHVLLNGAELNVPLGTTVANLLERFAAVAAAGGRSAQVDVHRGLAGVAIEGWPATLSAPVRLDWTGGCTWGDGTTWLDLPLLHGDCIDVNLG